MLDGRPDFSCLLSCADQHRLRHSHAMQRDLLLDMWKNVYTVVSMSALTATMIVQEFMKSAGRAGVVLASTGTVVVLSAALASSLVMYTRNCLCLGVLRSGDGCISIHALS